MHRTLVVTTSLTAAMLLVGLQTLAHAAADHPSDDPAVETERELQRITQTLLDAVGAGDKAVWDKYLDPGCLYTAEDGRTLDKQAFLAELRPLPPGYEGHLRLDNAEVRAYGNAAVISYDALESLSLYGQQIHTRFHTTDTWLRRDGDWRMIASQVTVIPGERTPVPVDPAVFAAYVGRYALAPDVVYNVTEAGGRLFVQSGGGEKQRLWPLDETRFFRKGARGEVVFVSDGKRVADKLILRRDNNDIVWTRLAD